jgi:non-canonical (house-cleaning) NTP pyrophosphatase
MSREAMQLALEALEDANDVARMEFGDEDYYGEAIAVLRQALETEPFEYWTAVEGWVKIDEVREHFDAVGCGTIYKSAGEGRSPLYTAPPKKQWVSLTDQEVWQAIDNVLEGGGWLDVARVLEQAFKEKNT